MRFLSAHIVVGLSMLSLAVCSNGSRPPTTPDGGRDAGRDVGDHNDADHSEDAQEDLDADHSTSDSNLDDASDSGLDGGPEDADRDDGDIENCSEPGPGCTCVLVPHDSEQSCWHSLGGLYGPAGCSASYQCCGGAWEAGTDVCGACSCSEDSGQEGCLGDADGELSCFLQFDGTASALPADVIELMTGLSWREGCPVGLDALSHLDMPHWGFDGEIHRGQMVVASEVAADVLAAFQRIYEARFAIEGMRLVDHYDADDDLSMAANNTSAFNCRAITGGSSWSQHSYGSAIDINPVQNPYVVGSTVLPPTGAAYTDRSDVRMGMIVEPGPVTAAFDAAGWGWGGRWSSIKDYQHFSESGM